MFWRFFELFSCFWTPFPLRALPDPARDIEGLLGPPQYLTFFRNCFFFEELVLRAQKELHFFETCFVMVLTRCLIVSKNRARIS